MQTVKIRDRTTYDGKEWVDRSRVEDRFSLARHLREVRANLDVVILRDGPGKYFMTNVLGPMRFERELDIARRKRVDSAR